MATPNEKLAASLSVLQKLQKNGRRVFQSSELSRVHRDRLLKHGFMQAVMKGWLISANPGVRPGDSTPWFASFWEFCARYCNERFGKDWHLSPELSLLLHAESTIIPSQAIIYSPKGHNNAVELLFRTSLYDLKEQQLPSRNDLVVRNGLRVFSPAAALIRVPESFYVRNPIETQVVLAGIRDTSELLRPLLDGGHSAIAGRLTGALRRVGRAEQAGEILSAMKAAGYDVRETDPFEVAQRVFAIVGATEAPIVGRLQAIWSASRDAVLESFPKPPGLPKNKTAYLNFVDEIYQSDAYHSLSIEGYRVNPELIERVMSGEWDPAHHEADRQSRDALAARGYWQAFQKVKGTVSKALAGENAGAIARADHKEWYRELFEPCVVSGLIPASALAGYRNDAVYLRNSRYVPPRCEAVRDAMPALFDLIEAEPEPSVRAVLGHWLFGYIHPYPDGNGRMARFLMNVLLASGGYAFINTVASAAAGAIGALWASFTSGRHPYEYEAAPWRDQTWRAAYISRFGSGAPKNLTLVLPSNAAELLRLSQPLPSSLADQKKLAEQMTLQINPELTAAIDAITNDTEWRMCYERIKFKVLFEGHLEPIQEVFGRLDSDFSLASAVLIAGAVLSARFRVWWLIAPAAAWIVLSVLRFCVRGYQIAEPWNTLGAQVEMLKTGRN